MDIQRSPLLSLLTINYSTLFIIILLVVFSAFFSLSETVYSSVSAYKLKSNIEEGKSGAKKALYITENFDKTLSTILVANNICNMGLATICVGFFAGFIKNGNSAELISMLSSTIGVLIFGEILPKTIAKQNSDKLALLIAPLVYFFMIVLSPIVVIFRVLQKFLSPSKEQISVDEDELESIIDVMEEEGTLNSDEAKLLRNVFDLNVNTVEDIMTHRMDIVAIDYESTIDEILEKLLENQYSRVPVYKEDKDHIIGILYERDFLSAYLINKNFKLDDILREVKYVSKAMKVDELIHELQKSKTHIAIVSGEYGDTLGLVTMEDCLEELVGEIYDEHDEESADTSLIEKISDNKYIVDGEIEIDDLFDELDIGNPPKDLDLTKLSSWIYESSKDIPTLGFIMKYTANFTKRNSMDEYEDFTKEVTFEVSEIEERRILKVIVTLEDVE